MGTQLETWASLCCAQGQSCSAPWSGTKMMHWLSTVPLQEHGAFPRLKGFGKVFQLSSYFWQSERPMRVMSVYSSTWPQRQKMAKPSITTLSLVEDKIVPLICNWKSHIFSCCSSSNNTRETRSSMPCFPLLSVMTNTTLVNKYQPYSKLNPFLFLRHLEQYNIKLQTMPVPLSSLSSNSEGGNCGFFPQR